MALDGTDDPLGAVISLGSVVAEKYRVDRVIGTGGMGVVVQAWHLQFEEAVAIKFLLPQRGVDAEALGRFEREARAAFKIKSEHVVRVIDVGRVRDDVPYMVMEFLEGTDLGEKLTNRTALPIDAAVEYVLQACEAVAEAHALGIVHRDLKPENLFLTRRADGTPCIKVLDFGLSKVHAVGKPRERALTSSAQVMGTPQYMSPEQWLGLADVGPAADQWALGVILYELLTGVQPFAQEQLAQLCTQVLNGEPERLGRGRPDAPAGLEQVILRALRKRPEDRYPNIAELAYDLHHYGPLRAKASARRIAGVFRRVGVEAPEVPEVARGGLGFGMVLGGAPVPVQAAAPPTSSPRAPASAPAADSAPASKPGAGARPAPPSQPPASAMAENGAPVLEPLPPTVPMGRAVTSQSWQSALDPQPPERNKRVWAAFAAIVLGLGLAVAFLLSRGAPEAQVGAKGGAASVGSRHAGEPAGERSPGDHQAPSADAGSASADAGTSKTAPPGVRPRRAPAGTSQPARRPGMFDHR